MKTDQELKEIVKANYSRIAEDSMKSGCGCGCGCSEPKDEYSEFSLDYSDLSGYNPDADLKLGCGIPTKHARIRTGDTVTDLGSGAGNDCFVAASLTEETGRVIGIDMSEPMIKKARINAEKIKATNIEFRLGEIENMPLEDNTSDTVISNCVLNLVPDKKKAFNEIYRILKPGGHFSISDIVIVGDMPEDLRKDAELYAGCVSGAISTSEYLDVIKNTRFINIQILDKIKTAIPDELLATYKNKEELKEFQAGENGMYSITVYAEKPA